MNSVQPDAAPANLTTGTIAILAPDRPVAGPSRRCAMKASQAGSC